jgi:putative flippase GtrA
MDGHRHVHLIPAVFEETLKLQKKYAVERIRLMNECALLTKRCNSGRGFLFDGGLIKYLLLRFLTMLNGVSSDCYFYTMLYTCKLSREHFENVLVPKGFQKVEIMIHPSRTDIDAQHMEDIFDPSVVSPWRTKELETLKDKSVLQNFHFDTPYPLILRLYQKLEQWWFSLPQQGRYLLVGGFNTVFAYGMFALLAAGIGIPYLPALVLQYLITVNVSVLTMRYYVFRSRGNAVREWLKGWTVYLGMFVFNSVFLAFLVEICHLGELVGQAVYLSVSTVLTYFLHKYFSFRRKIKEK